MLENRVAVASGLLLLAEVGSWFGPAGERQRFCGDNFVLCLPQDDRMRNPLLKLKLAVCSVMPEQIAKYNMECMAKVAK